MAKRRWRFSRIAAVLVALLAGATLGVCAGAYLASPTVVQVTFKPRPAIFTYGP